jgi:uncharacterized damage-inducible protein DinB
MTEPRYLQTPTGADPTILPATFEVLEQGEILLESIDDDTYVRKMPVAYGASIGGHYRHCLDHFQSIAAARDQNSINYDQRKRDPLVESDRFAALNETCRLREALATFGAVEMDREVQVVCKTSYSASGSQTANATIGRELMYAVAHAVHHFALIGIIAQLQGVRLPPGFGVAPSTIKHQESQSVLAS